jgi:hypothetical protein
VPKTSDGEQSANKGQRNLPSNKKGPGNIIRPQNQQGRRTSPNIRRSDLTWLSVIENALESEYNVIDIIEVIEEDKKGPE